MAAARLKVALFGTPAFALPTLEALNRHHDLLLVVTQSPKPAGRGLMVNQPAVAKRAEELGLRVVQPTRLKGNDELRALLAALDLDVAVTAAYGRILPQSLLDVPKHGFLNVHASLLPRYRGAAPIQRALIDGAKRTGVSIMQTEAGLDTGPVRLQRAIDIGEGEGATALSARLAQLGAETLLEALDLLAAGRLAVSPQDDALATPAPPLTPEDGRVRWSDPRAAVLARHRGVDAWPFSHFEHAGERVKVLEMRAPALQPSEARDAGADPSTVVAVAGDSLLVATGDDPLEMVRLQPASGRAMSARAWANGRGVKRGTKLG